MRKTWIALVAGLILMTAGSCKQSASIIKIIATPTQPVAETRLPTATLMIIPPTASLTLTMTPVPEPTSWRMTVMARVAANVRSAPNDEAAVIGALPPGTQVDVLEFAQEWYKVQAKSLDLPGWMHQSVLAAVLTTDLARTPNAGAQTPTATVLPRQMFITAKTTANVRAKPADDGALVAQLPRGASVRALAISGEWYQISASAFQGEGWVHASVIGDSPAPELPTPTVAATAAQSPTPQASPATPPVAPGTGTPWLMYVSAREEANVRAAPADDGEIIGILVRGTQVTVLQASGEWLQVRSDAAAREGWVHNSVLSQAPVVP